jgi:N-glycosylase/DNA lyase
MANILLTKEVIENAVLRVSSEIALTNTIIYWNTLPEETLWFELVACILGSRVKYELAKAHFRRLKVNGLINIKIILANPQVMEDKISDMLNSPIITEWNTAAYNKYPFSRMKSRQIIKTCTNIFSKKVSGLKGLLKSAKNAEEARNLLIESCSGIGPKQASLFLRNISFCDNLAIFDSHVIRFMIIMGLIKHKVSTITRKEYLIYEQILRSYSDSLNATLAVLDLAIWVVMKVISEECGGNGSCSSNIWRNRLDCYVQTA